MAAATARAAPRDPDAGRGTARAARSAYCARPRAGAALYALRAGTRSSTSGLCRTTIILDLYSMTIVENLDLFIVLFPVLFIVPTIHSSLARSAVHRPGPANVLHVL